MPILKKEEFERIAPPQDLKPHDEVFYNQVTNEVFTDYDDYFARVILCNSLVWTCSLTGKSGLTFQDAQESEEASREMVRTFPRALRKPVLFITNLTSRGRFADLLDDVFNFVKDRFFVGEELDYMINGRRKLGKLSRIHPTSIVPTEQKGDTPKGKKRETNDVLKIKYDIQDIDSGETFEVQGKDIFRKRTFTRDRLRIYLKMATEQQGTVLRVIGTVAEKYKLAETKYADIHIGKEPEFIVSPSKRLSKALKKEVRVKEKKEKKEGKGKEKKKKENAKESNKENKAKPNSKEDSEKKAAREEAKLIRQQFTAAWSRPREDLTLDGPKDLPAITSFDCGVPQAALSDAFCVLEFFAAFQQEFRVKDYFASGITFDILERAVSETDVLGPLVDIFQILLTNLFKLKVVENNFNYDETRPSDYRPEPIYSAQRHAAFTMRDIRQAFGFSLTQLTLDSFTLSEVLRLHIESSGAPGNVKKAGNMDPAEDPGLAFRIENPKILEALRTASLFELEAADKLKLLRLIVEQLLCTDGVRDMIEEASETYKSSKSALRKLRIMKKNSTEGKPTISPREFERREAELQEKIRNSREKLMMVPLGEDRAYRRYYIAYSIPALIVEDDATHIGGSCIEGGTPKEPIISPPLAFMKQFVQNISAENSSLSMLTSLKGAKEGEIRVKSEHGPFTCTGDQSSCFVHNRSIARDNWRLISSKEQLDDLIAALDSRGIRENPLKKALQAQLENLYWAIERCPLHILNRNFENTRKAKMPSAQIKKSNLYGVTPSFALELSFRELILELEERLYSGGLGHLKDIDREAWREDLVSILYIVSNLNKPSEINELKKDPDLKETLRYLTQALKTLGFAVEKKVLMAPLGSAEPPTKVKKSQDVVAEAVPLVKENFEAWLKELQPAWLQANGHSEEQSNGNHKDTPAQNGSAENALMDDDASSSTSSNNRNATQGVLNLPRVFLLMYSLERSVMWMRSVSNAACRVCRKKSNPEQMLLCDGCDRGHHIYCLKPPLSEIPKGDWFCSQCTPTQLSPRKRTRAPVEVSSEEEEEEDNDDNDEEEDDENQGDDAEEDEEEEDLNQEVCNICESPGELILCDFCPKSFHLDCIDLKRLPRGTWKCPPCVKGKKGRRGSPPLTKVKVRSRNNIHKYDLATVADVESFDYMVCCDIVKLLVRSEHSWPFLDRVTRKDAPNYYNVIKKPMDFGTLQGKLNDVKYRDNAGFVSDVFQIIANCLVYNNPRRDEVTAATALSVMFCEILTQVGLESLISLKDSILEETEESSGWSKGKPQKDAMDEEDEEDEDEEEEEDEEEADADEDCDEDDASIVDAEMDAEDEEQDEDDDENPDDQPTKKTPEPSEPPGGSGDGGAGAGDEGEADDSHKDKESDKGDGDGNDRRGGGKKRNKGDDEEDEDDDEDDGNDSAEDEEQEEDDYDEEDDDDDDDEDYGKPKARRGSKSKRKASPPQKKTSSRKRKRTSRFGESRDEDDDDEDDEEDEDYAPKRRSSSRRST